jgi:hypothetical protein
MSLLQRNTYVRTVRWETIRLVGLELLHCDGNVERHSISTGKENAKSQHHFGDALWNC